MKLNRRSFFGRSGAVAMAFAGLRKPEDRANVIAYISLHDHDE